MRQRLVVTVVLMGWPVLAVGAPPPDVTPPVFVTPPAPLTVECVNAPLVTTFAGNGSPGPAGDGLPATLASLSLTTRVAVDPQGAVFIAEGGFASSVRRVDPGTGTITTVAGFPSWPGFAGDNGLALSALLNDPRDLAVDAGGNLFIADAGNARVRRVDATTGIITTVAGGGFSTQEGGPAIGAYLPHPVGLHMSGTGELLIVDDALHSVRRVDASGIITTVVNLLGVPGYFGDGGAALGAGLTAPSDVAGDGAGNLFIADTGNHTIRRVDAISGVISTAAGWIGPGYVDGPAGSARFDSPRGLAWRGDDLYVADYSNNRIRRLDTSAGLVSTVAGSGIPSATDCLPPLQTGLFAPLSLAFDGAGGLLMADTGNVRVRELQSGSVDLGPVAISDAVDPSPTLTNDAPSVFPLGLTTVTWTATDASGNVATATQVVTAVDTCPPMLVPPPDLTLECTSGFPGQVVALGTPTVSDACDPAPALSNNAPPLFNLGTTPVTWTATDASGNVATATQQVTIVDTTPPSITAPADVTVECSGPGGQAVFLGLPAVSDACGLVGYALPPQQTYPLGSTTVTWTAVDGSGNSASDTQVVTVVDTIGAVVQAPPPLTVYTPSNIPTVPLNDPAIAAWIASATASDGCDPAPVLLGPLAPLSFSLNTTSPVTFIAVDASGNTSNASSSVTVLPLGIEIYTPTLLGTPDNTTGRPVPLEFRHTGDEVLVSGTRTRGGVVTPAGPGPRYTEDGVYRITAITRNIRGTASASLAFTIDATPPVVAIRSPVAVPNPGAPPPADLYTYGSRIEDPLPTDLPIAIDVDASDDDGVPGGVASLILRLDGRPLDVRVSAAEAAEVEPFYSLLPGDHALRLSGVPGGEVHLWLRDGETPSWQEFPGDGEALLTGILFAAADPAHRWRVELRFWSLAAPPAGPRLELLPALYAPSGPVDPTTWRFFALDPDRSALQGLGANAGTTLLPQALPESFLQVGVGANGRNPARGLSARLAFAGGVSGELNLSLGAAQRLLTPEVFAQLGLPVLGPHQLVASARDERVGNEGRASVGFEVAQRADWGLLHMLRPSLNDPAHVYLAALVDLPTPLGGNPLHPIYSDVVPATLRLESVRTGRVAAPDVVVDLGGFLLLLVRRAALADAGEIEREFVLRGRFFGLAGPAFLARDRAAPLPPRPVTPDNVSAVVEPGPQVRLQWSDRSARETGFRVERRDEDGDAFYPIGMAPAGATAFTDAGVGRERYRYRVVAVEDAVGGSDPSNVVTIRVP